MGEGGEGKKKLKKKKVDVVFSDTRPSCCAREGVPGGQCHLYTLPLTCFGFLSICDFRLGKKFRKKDGQNYFIGMNHLSHGVWRAHPAQLDNMYYLSAELDRPDMPNGQGSRKQLKVSIPGGLRLARKSRLTRRHLIRVRRGKCSADLHLPSRLWWKTAKKENTSSSSSFVRFTCPTAHGHQGQDQQETNDSSSSQVAETSSSTERSNVCFFFRKSKRCDPWSGPRSTERHSFYPFLFFFSFFLRRRGSVCLCPYMQMPPRKRKTPS